MGFLKGKNKRIEIALENRNSTNLTFNYKICTKQTIIYLSNHNAL